MLYIGKKRDNSIFEIEPQWLTRHTAVFGATGSGKTVMCKAIIEEALVSGIPVLAIDPKGDISCLALALADENPLSFRPWSDEEAINNNMNPDIFAEKLHRKYKEEFRKWNIPDKKVSKYRKSVEVKIYTPKSDFGLSISLSPELELPENFQQIESQNPSLLNSMIESTADSLLKPVGYKENDLESAFLSEIIYYFWKKGISPDLKMIIEAVREPPFSKIGALNLDEFISEKRRKSLASNLNMFLTSPSLRTWFSGDPLNYNKIFSENKYAISVIDLRWITDEKEKQFFVGMIMQNLFKWLLKKPGTQRLKYLIYFDEIAGYIPSDPKNPPSKKSLKLIVKQARAFGLGCIFATQNPGDIDYTVISNMGNRFIGNLKTVKDIEKIATGIDLPLSNLKKIISNLSQGEFFYSNPDKHISEIIYPRWLITYHRGPLTDKEISVLMKKFKKTYRDKSPSHVARQKKSSQEIAVIPPDIKGDIVFKKPVLKNKDAEVIKYIIYQQPYLYTELTGEISLKTGKKTANYTVTKYTLLPLYESPEEDTISFLSNRPELLPPVYIKKIFSEYCSDIEEVKIEYSDYKDILGKVKAEFLQTLPKTLYYSDYVDDTGWDSPANIIKRLSEAHMPDYIQAKTKIEEKYQDRILSLKNKIEKIKAEIYSLYKEKNIMETELNSFKKEMKKRKKASQPILKLKTSINSRERKIIEVETKIKKKKADINMLRTKIKEYEENMLKNISLIEKKFESQIKEKIKSVKISSEDIKISTKVKIAYKISDIEVSLRYPVKNGKKTVLIKYHGDFGRGPPCSLCQQEISEKARGILCYNCGAIVCNQHGSKCMRCKNYFCKKDINMLKYLFLIYYPLCNSCITKKDYVYEKYSKILIIIILLLAGISFFLKSSLI